jgi:heat shock protein HtpX
VVKVQEEKMWSLQLRLWFLVTLLFGLIYALVVVVGRVFLHVGDFTFYFIISLVMMFIQYLIGPKMVEWSMRVRYIKREEQPRLYSMVEGLAMRAQIPVPRIGISQVALPNAFAFGRSLRDGRVCVTEGILKLLNEEELKAVLGHELTHLKSRDMLTITLLSVIPMVMYRIAWQFLFYGRRRDERGANTALIGLAALLFYFITNLLVLYASRIREYFADRGSILLGNRPAVMASSLYKLVYGSARMDKESLKQTEGLKAFFVNDPSQAVNEIKELAQLDLNKSGDRLLELLSTHPNMLKRIKQLSEYHA